jgi:hypothetical protein
VKRLPEPKFSSSLGKTPELARSLKAAANWT